MARLGRLLAQGLLAAGAGLWIAGGEKPRGARILAGRTPAPTSPPDAITALSWNIHYGYGPCLDRGRGASRKEVSALLDAIGAELRAHDPDIVALQEVDRGALRSHGIDQLAWLREASGLPHAAWTETWRARWVPYPGVDPRQHIGTVRSGQAILSRFPLREAQRHDLPQPRSRSRLYNRFYLHRALLRVTADLGAGVDLDLTTAHFEAFDRENCALHAEMTRRLLASGGHAARYALLLGDMNSVPPEASLRHDFADEPHTDMREDRTVAILRSIPGLHDTAPPEDYLAHEAQQLTFPAWAPNRRLDYIFHGDGFEREWASVPAQPSPPSDHLPVLARLKLRAP